MKAFVGQIVVVREGGIQATTDGEVFKTSRVAPGIVTEVAKDGTVSVQLLNQPTYSGQTVHASEDALAAADDQAETARHVDAICAYAVDAGGDDHTAAELEQLRADLAATRAQLEDLRARTAPVVPESQQSPAAAGLAG
jgi:hypothetical protein